MRQSQPQSRAVAPRPPRSEDAVALDSLVSGEKAELLELIPYGRVGNVEDIANAAVWLGSDLSDYVTGATLYVDGGMTLYPGFREGG